MENLLSQRQKLVSAAEELRQLSSGNGFDGIARSASVLLDRLGDQSFRITVVGEFNRGKSTLVNALLEYDLIPTAARETTATINVIGYGETPRITVVDQSAGRKEISPTKDAFKEYTSLQNLDPNAIHHVEIECPAPLLKNNVFLVDTPGVNDISQQRLDITYGYMPISDATIVLLDARKPFTASEKSFLQDHILKNNIPSLFFLINKIDLIDPGQVAGVVDDVAAKLKQTLNIQDVCIMPVSSELARRGFFRGEESCLEQSRLGPFKQALMKFLSEGERSISTIKGAQLSIGSLASTFLDDINVEISQVQKTIGQLREQLTTLHESKGELSTHFDEIIGYIDTDASALDSRIETVLLARGKELFDQFVVEIDTSSADLTDYAEKILPYKYNQFMKVWIDNNSQSIEQFQQFTASNAITAFEERFGKAPLLDFINEKCSFGQTGDMSPMHVSGRDQLKMTNTIAAIAGGIVAGGLAIYTGGLAAAVMPSLIGGSFLSGKYITPYFARQVLEDQRNELKQLLREKMKIDYEKKAQILRQSCSEYYAALKGEFAREYEGVLDDLSSDIQQRIEEQSKQDRSVEDRLKELQFLRSKVESVKAETLGILLM